MASFSRFLPPLASAFVTVMHWAHEITLGLGLLSIAWGWYTETPINVLLGLIIAVGPFANIVVDKVIAERRAAAAELRAAREIEAAEAALERSAATLNQR